MFIAYKYLSFASKSLYGISDDNDGYNYVISADFLILCFIGEKMLIDIVCFVNLIYVSFGYELLYSLCY